MPADHDDEREDRVRTGHAFLPRVVRVEGPSMAPTLRAGDCLLLRGGARARAGDVVVARFPAAPELLVVKRAVRPVPGGWWLESDNPFVADDSRRYGVGVVLARVVLRWWPLPPSRLRSAS